MSRSKNTKGASQVYNPKTNRYVEKDASGKFAKVNSQPNKKFPGVEVEK
ncbi:MAG: hypothetical protein PHC46_00315 [Clostridia bacterium]|nr:hypothetical protein [Clostridia bacterium]